MVVGMDDLGLSLSLPSATATATATNTTHQKSHHHMGFSMTMNTNNNNTNIIHHPQMTSSGDNIITNNNNSTTCSPLQLNLMTSPFVSSILPNDRSVDACGSYLRGIDVNVSTRAGGGEEEDVIRASSPNSTVSTVSGKRSSGDRDSGGEAEMERASSRGVSDDDDGGENSKKKLRLTKDQSATLEESFKEHTTLNPKQKLALAKRLGLRPRQVEVWFQNRRARTKLKQTEVDCEFLKGCCEKLTEENRRLQKEVQELRALKLSPQFYMHMTPPTTLTMCPSCERVAGPTSQPRSSPHSRPVPANLLARGLVPTRPVDAPQLRL